MGAGRAAVARKAALAAALVAPGVAGGELVFASAASADAAACANAPGAAILNQDCIEVDGSGRHVDDAQMRAWRIDAPGVPQNICGYNSRVMGSLHNGGAWSRTGNFHNGCVFAAPAWMDHPVNRDFQNETWFRGEWKEDGVWTGRHPMVCIELNPWDFC